MTDVVLINAPWKQGYNRCGRWGGRTISESVNPPLGFLYAGAVLENHGYSVRVIDALAENFSLEQVTGIVCYLNPKLVVIETNCASIDADVECARVIKTTPVGGVAKVGLCGVMATSNHKQLIRKHGFIDFCVLGEYDYTILKLLEHKFWKHVDGVTYRDSLGIHHGQKTEYIEDLDSLPYPAHHLVDSSLYDEIIIQKRPFVQTVESRSCPYACTFCTSHSMFGERWRSMSAKRIVDEMEYWQNKGIKEVFWDGETFTVNKKRCFEVCRLIKERGLTVSWSCLSRADTVAPRMLKYMADANCILIRYGFENGNQNILDFIGKGYSVETILNASKWSRDVGILVHGAWMFVAPHETEASVNRTIELAKQTCDTAQFTVCMPYAGTAYFDTCKKNGWLLTEDWTQFLASDKSVVKSDLDLGKMVVHGYKSFYLRPSFLTKSIYRELKKGTLRDAIKIGLKVLGVKKYW